jgi:MOSC domain-containing protein
VVSLWRYPVRSMRGETLAAAHVTLRGVLGDRSYAVIDPTRNRRVTVGDGPRRWARMLTLAACYTRPPRPAQAPPPVQIHCDDGSSCASDAPEVTAWLSAKLGESVALWCEADAEGAAPRPGRDEPADEPSQAYETAPIHLLTTASLRAAGAHAQGARFAPERFRPNLVVDTGDAEGFVEDSWVGRTLALGDALRVEIVERSERCVMTTLAQGELDRDPRVFKAVADANERCLGVYAQVVAAGALRAGDSVALL